MGVVTAEQVVKHFEEKRDQYIAAGFKRFYEDACQTIIEIKEFIVSQKESDHLDSETHEH
jgi:hypothetical protein